MKKNLIRTCMTLGLMAVALFVSACTNGQKAEPEAMTGQQQHERHATGMESQVSDY